MGRKSLVFFLGRHARRALSNSLPTTYTYITQFVPDGQSQRLRRPWRRASRGAALFPRTPGHEQTTAMVCGCMAGSPRHTTFKAMIRLSTLVSNSASQGCLTRWKVRKSGHYGAFSSSSLCQLINCHGVLPHANKNLVAYLAKFSYTLRFAPPPKKASESR